MSKKIIIAMATCALLLAIGTPFFLRKKISFPKVLIIDSTTGQPIVGQRLVLNLLKKGKEFRSEEVVTNKNGIVAIGKIKSRKGLSATLELDNLPDSAQIYVANKGVDQLLTDFRNDLYLDALFHNKGTASVRLDVVGDDIAKVAESVTKLKLSALKKVSESKANYFRFDTSDKPEMLSFNFKKNKRGGGKWSVNTKFGNQNGSKPSKCPWGDNEDISNVPNDPPCPAGQIRFRNNNSGGTFCADPECACWAKPIDPNKCDPTDPEPPVTPPPPQPPTGCGGVPYGSKVYPGSTVINGLTCPAPSSRYLLVLKPDGNLTCIPKEKICPCLKEGPVKDQLCGGGPTESPSPSVSSAPSSEPSSTPSPPDLPCPPCPPGEACTWVLSPETGGYVPTEEFWECRPVKPGACNQPGTFECGTNHIGQPACCPDGWGCLIGMINVFSNVCIGPNTEGCDGKWENFCGVSGGKPRCCTGGKECEMTDQYGLECLCPGAVKNPLGDCSDCAKHASEVDGVCKCPRRTVLVYVDGVKTCKCVGKAIMNEENKCVCPPNSTDNGIECVCKDGYKQSGQGQELCAPAL